MPPISRPSALSTGHPLRESTNRATTCPGPRHVPALAAQVAQSRPGQTVVGRDHPAALVYPPLGSFPSRRGETLQPGGARAAMANGRSTGFAGSVERAGDEPGRWDWGGRWCRVVQRALPAGSEIGGGRFGSFPPALSSSAVVRCRACKMPRREMEMEERASFPRASPRSCLHRRCSPAV